MVNQDYLRLRNGALSRGFSANAAIIGPFTYRKLGSFLAFGLLIVSAPQAESDDIPVAEQEVNELAAVPSVRKALAFLQGENDRNLRDLIELTEIPAPPFGESARALRFSEMLEQAGLHDVAIDAVGNVIGVRRGVSGERTVALAAHMDTVFPPGTDVSVRREGNTFYAPGIGDNTRGMVVVLSILRAFEALEIQTTADVLFIGTVGEEGLGDLRGVRYLLRDSGPKIDTLIAVDGGSIGRIVSRGVGSHRYRVTISGPGGHSWKAFGTANPHHALGELIASFIQYARVETSSGEKTTFSIGRVGGGTSINSIATESWLEIDLRSGDKDKLDRIDAVFQQAVLTAVAAENRARTEGPPLTVDVVSVGKRPAGETPANSRLVTGAIAALKTIGVEARLEQSSTDANIAMAMGIPAITISRGGVNHNSHAPDEQWENTDSHLALQSAFLLLLNEARLSD